MDVVWTLLGVAVIAIALRDIFDVLFHPLGRGMVARWVVRSVGSAARHLPGGEKTIGLLAGPIGYVAVVATWAALLTLGWALVFWPQLPQGFHFDTGLNPAQHAGFLDALYVSLVNLTSLGYGDISPESPLLRILGPVETMFGLGLLTASISWLISIYNAISRRDSLAHEVHLAKESEERLGEKLADADPQLLESLLAGFAEQLIRCRRDLIHFPITHYFRTEDEERALAGCCPSSPRWSTRRAARIARTRCGCGRKSCGWRSTTSPRRCERVCGCPVRTPTTPCGITKRNTGPSEADSTTGTRGLSWVRRSRARG